MHLALMDVLFVPVDIPDLKLCWWHHVPIMHLTSIPRLTLLPTLIPRLGKARGQKQDETQGSGGDCGGIWGWMKWQGRVMDGKEEEVSYTHYRVKFKQGLWISSLYCTNVNVLVLITESWLYRMLLLGNPGEDLQNLSVLFLHLLCKLIIIFK